MPIYLIVFLIIFFLKAIDILMTYLYCMMMRNRMTRYIKSVSSKKGQSKTSLLKFFGHLYRGWIRYKLIRLGRIPCHAFRKVVLKTVYLMDIHKKVVLYGGFEIRAPWGITIGEGSIIGDESKLDGRNGLKIGKNVNFSTGVWIWTEQHDINDELFECNNKGGMVTIDDRVWLSARTLVLPGVHISEGAVIAAGAIVTKNCESFTVYGGIPAKIIGKRNNQIRYVFDGKHETFW